MKAGTSYLNPYAASYIPLSRRGLGNENKVNELTAKDSKSGDEGVWLGSHPGHATQSQYHKASQNYNAYGADTLQTAEDSKLKGHTFYGSYGSSSQNPTEMTEKQILVEEQDMDLAYLQMTFPGISDECLSDVYLANQGDLEATVDMLNQLELNLPDTLDIGDVLEAGTSSECSSVKLKKVAGEVGGSSSGSWTRPLSPE